MPEDLQFPEPFRNHSPSPTLITQGAEALLYQTYHLESKNQAALKVRPSKPYRHPILDTRLTKQRMLAEARVLVKLAGLGESVNEMKVPTVFSLDWEVGKKVKGLSDEQKKSMTNRGDKSNERGSWLLMEWIDGKSVKELLRDWDLRYNDLSKQGSSSESNISEKDISEEEEKEVKILLRRIGRAIGIMHSKGGVIHGDLTSSNIMIRPIQKEVKVNGVVNGDHVNGSSISNPKFPDLDGEIVLIDFGLATQSIQDEDRAVDLYVLERAFGSTHPRQEGWFDQEVLQSQDGYRGSFRGAAIVLKRLEEVRLRGRKRSMIG